MKKTEVKVLLVDDELNLAEAMQRILALEGFQVRTAASGHQALDLCRAVAPYIVLLDFNMQDLNGLETYRRMRAIIPEVPVVMITGYGRSLRQAIEEAHQLGVKSCIEKPFKIQQIFESIRTYVPYEN